MPGEKEDELRELGLVLAFAACRCVEHALYPVESLEEFRQSALCVGQEGETLEAETLDEHFADASCIRNGTEEVGQRTCGAGRGFGGGCRGGGVGIYAENNAKPPWHRQDG